MFDFAVRDGSGALVAELSWSGPLDAPAGSEWFRLERTMPDLAPGQYTFTGTVTHEGVPTSDTSQLYVANRLRVADDFADVLSGWPNGTDGRGVFGYLDGEYRIAFGGADAYRWASPPSSPTLDDLAVEADMRRPGTAAGWVGLVFGLTAGGDDFHLVEIDRLGQYSLFRNVNGTWQTLVPPTFSAFLRTGEAGNHLLLVRDSGLTRLFANGQEVTLITDVAAPAGRTGVYASSAEAGLDGRFDNFRAYSLR
jgi:hypothetical protein